MAKGIATWPWVALVLIGLQPSLFAQGIEGWVLDAINQQPLEGANITTSSTPQGTVTDGEGYFRWNQQIPSDTTLIVSHLGYETQSILVSVSRPVRIFMNASLYQLPHVVVSGTAQDQHLLKVPGPMAIITGKQLERDNSLNIAQPLNRIPGVYMHSGALNTNRITIRGIGSRSLFSTSKIRAYLNDIPLTSGDGETTLEDIDLSLIDRVEIIKGPSSSIYGAGLGGTINLKVGKAPSQATNVFNDFSTGSYGLIRNVTGLAVGRDRLNLKLNFSKVHQDGYRDNNQYDRSSLSLMTHYFLKENRVLTFWGNWIDLKAFIPSSLDSADFAENPSQAAFTWAQTRGFEDYQKGLFGVNIKEQVAEQWGISISLFGNLRQAYELRPFNVLDETSTALGSRFKVDYQPEVSFGKLSLVLGGELFRERYKWKTLETVDRMSGDLLSDNNELRKYLNVFTEITLDLSPSTTLTAGLNYNITQFDYRDNFLENGDLSGDYQFDNQWSPRIGVNHLLNSFTVVYGQISHGFSPPSLSETLTPDGAINPDIQPETGYNFELGTRGELLHGRLWWDISFYSMHIRNLLVARRTGDDIFVGVNAGKTRHNGIDFSLNYRLPVAAWSFLFWSNYAFSDYIFKEFIDGDLSFSGNELTGTPRHKVSAGIDLTHQSGWYGNINLLGVGAMPIRDDNSIYSEAYGLINTKVGYRTQLVPALMAHFYGGLSNLTNTRYASMLAVNAGSFGGNAPRYFYPGLPINYYLGLKLNYQF